MDYEIIPVDDITDSYIKASHAQRAIVSSVLADEYISGVHSNLRSDSTVSVVVSCNAEQGHQLVMALSDTLKEQYGVTWLQNLCKALLTMI